jgi:opacity protein-like surface antigen
MNFRKWNCYVLCVFLFAVHSEAVLASSIQSENTPVPSIFVNFADMIKSSWVATASLGFGWENAGNTQTFYLAPELEKTYTADNSTHSFPSGELFLGIQRTLHKKIQGQLGFEIARTGDANVSGNIWDDADSRFNNYTYKYAVQHTHIALKGKLLGDMGWPVQPWISAAVGVGFNRSDYFSNLPIIFEAVPAPNFNSNTTTAFTYTIGAGFEQELTKHWKAGLGYEFADWGKSQLRRAAGQTLNSGLSLSHLYNSSILLNLTYQS